MSLIIPLRLRRQFGFVWAAGALAPVAWIGGGRAGSDALVQHNKASPPRSFPQHWCRSSLSFSSSLSSSSSLNSILSWSSNLAATAISPTQLGRFRAASAASSADKISWLILSQTWRQYQSVWAESGTITATVWPPSERRRSRSKVRACVRTLRRVCARSRPKLAGKRRAGQNKGRCRLDSDWVQPAGRSSEHSGG